MQPWTKAKREKLSNDKKMSLNEEEYASVTGTTYCYWLLRHKHAGKSQMLFLRRTAVCVCLQRMASTDLRIPYWLVSVSRKSVPPLAMEPEMMTWITTSLLVGVASGRLLANFYFITNFSTMFFGAFFVFIFVYTVSVYIHTHALYHCWYSHVVPPKLPKTI